MSLNKNCEEQREAIRLAQNGNENILNDLMEANKGLVISKIYALGFNQASKDFEDMYQEGMIGLYTAILKFDLSMGTAFSTYACDWIDQCIRRTKTFNSRIHIPEYRKFQLSKYKKAHSKLYSIIGIEPTIHELAQELNISIQECEELQELLAMTTSSLNDYKYTDNDGDKTNYTEFGDEYSSEESDFLYQLLENKEFKLNILNLILNSNLTDDEIIIILLRYGLVKITEKRPTLLELAEMFGYSRETIRFKENNALKKLIDNPNILDLLNHTQNPSLALRKVRIKNLLNTKTFTNEYSTFYSIFKEYSREEIKEIYEEMNSHDKAFLDSITITSEEEHKFTKFTKREGGKLFDIILETYTKLINKHGGRRPINS